MYYFLPVIFSVFNRIRGSHLTIFKLPLYSIFKNVFGIVLATLIYLNSNFSFFSWKMLMWVLACSLAYRFGEAEGWGKWVASILDRHPKYDDNEGKITRIHQIANFFIKEKKDWLNYSRLALALRGVYWWLPVLLVFIFSGTVSIQAAIISLIPIGIGFPIGMEIGRKIRISWSMPKFQYKHDRWAWGEVVYGLIQGIVFAFIL